MKTKVTKCATKTNTNLSRLHEVMDGPHTVIKVDHEDLYVGDWYEDANGGDVLCLQVTNGDGLTFSKDAIEQGTINQNSITMMADDGQEYLLAFFITTAAML